MKIKSKRVIQLVALGLIWVNMESLEQCFSDDPPPPVSLNYGHTYAGSSGNKVVSFPVGTKVIVNSATFGGDPAPGYQKFVFLNQQRVATEGQTYYVPGLPACQMVTVWYKPINGNCGLPDQPQCYHRSFCAARQVSCANSTFGGDPTLGNGTSACTTSDGTFLAYQGNAPFTTPGANCTCAGVAVGQLNDYQALSSTDIEAF